MRMPKELVKSAVLTQKEKPHQISRETDIYETQSSPTEYASKKLKTGERRIFAGAGSAGKSGVRVGRAAVNRIRERKMEQEPEKRQA